MTDEHDALCGCAEYQELSRREFLQSSAGVSGAYAAAMAFPAWLPKVVMADSYQSTRDIIVSVFQRGGVDGLTVCVPFTDVNYYNARSTIAIQPPDAPGITNKSVAIDNQFAFPYAMRNLLNAYTASNLLVVHATGQQSNSRSHFDAQRYMELGKAADPSLVTGWLGRHLATAPPIRSDSVLRGIGLAPGLQKTLVGGPQTLPIADPTNFSLGGSSTTRVARTDLLEANYTGTMEPLRSAALDAVATMDLLAGVNFTLTPNNGAIYPNTSFGRALKNVAALIKQDVGIEAAQVDIGGWDTHATQDPNAGSMYNTMNDFANSLGAFWADVIVAGFPVTVVCVSEFGRNLRENGSTGTDHGRGTTMFAMGQNIAGGRVLTNWPGLAMENLEDRQDLKVTIDYRDILSEIVQNRLGNSNLGAVFPGWTPTMRGVTL